MQLKDTTVNMTKKEEDDIAKGELDCPSYIVIVNALKYYYLYSAT